MGVSGVKIGLISDIHCNVAGLTAALATLNDCEHVLCAGDLLYQYRFSSEILTLLREHKVHTIVGNHDRTILYAPAHPLRASASVDPTELRYLGSLPTSLTLTLDGARVAMFHGSPWDDGQSTAAHYVYQANQHDVRRVAETSEGADIVVLGHTHQAFSTWVGETLIVNPGSCGESRDPSGLLTCAAVDTATGAFDIRSFAV